jgi:purine-binding chemotaxis protein CheW
LLLEGVKRVVHAVEIRELPAAPKVILGVINVKGEVIPVASIRKILNLKAKRIHPDDNFIIADTGSRVIAVHVDSVKGIELVNKQLIIEAKKNIPDSGPLKGIANAENGMILIYDLEKFLSPEDEFALDNALSDIQR